MKRLPSLLLALVVLAFGLPLMAPAAAQTPAGVAAGRDTEPVVLTGDRFPEWAVPADVALEAPSANGALCEGTGQENPGEGPCTHNQYEDPDAQSSTATNAAGLNGKPVDRLLGYRWTGDGFEQIPFQVDEMFVRYLSNNNSGFSFYSETDQHTAYAFDREGFRWTDSDPNNPCLAQPASEVAKDPVQGLDTDDELVFMYNDAGERAPSDAPAPSGIEGSYEVAIADPTNPGAVSFVYVMLSGPDGPDPAFDETNGYVRYERDADSNTFLFSESSFENYGATFEGPWFDPETGVCHSAEAEWKQHRPGDQATITTPRYRFRYEGRWLMTELQVDSDAGTASRFADLDAAPDYGPDLIDQWKARAFQQRPGGEMPCCGYEEEVNNWGGSSIMMGELAGPVRVIRETWGADSGTNVVRREIFYRDEIRFGSFLRVHVIPPLDGIYAQWDYNAGRMTNYYNTVLSARGSDPVAIDGQDDEQIGNSRVYVGQDGIGIEDPALPPIVLGDPDVENCSGGPEVCNDVDSPDPTFSGVNQGANWEEVAGPHATLVWRTHLKQVTPGAAQSVVAVPYYRDDSCFDDGTGSNPGPHLNPRNEDEGPFAQHNGAPRRCWTPEDGVPGEDSDATFWQGSIGTHGVHLLMIAESDNATATVPLTEIDSEQRAVILPPVEAGGSNWGDPTLGDAYGRGNEKPLVVTTVSEPLRTTSDEPEKQATELALTGAGGGQITDDATLSATLTSEGSGVPGKVIDFTLDGQSVGQAETDANGVASLTVTLEGPARSTTQSATFAGDDSHSASSASAPFEVSRDDAVLTVSSTFKSAKASATATLTDADSGAGLEGRTIRFFVNGVEAGTATTDAQGVATGSFRAKKGAAVTAAFDGDDSYSAAQS